MLSSRLRPKFNQIELDRTSALADSRASINLLPYSIYKQLGLEALTPTRMTPELANRRPFLRTAKALIDLYEETLTLRVGKEELVYYADKSEKNEEKKFNDKDVEIKSSSSFTLTSPKESELEAYLERDSIPPGMMTCIAIRKKIICLLATFLNKKPKPLSRPQEVDDIKMKDDKVSSQIPIDTIVMPIRITFDNPINFNDHFSKPKDLKTDFTVAFDSTESSILPPPLLDSDSPFTAELSASVTLNSLGNEDKVFKPGLPSRKTAIELCGFAPILIEMVEDQLFELVELGHYLQKYLRKTYPCQRVQVNAVLVEVAEESVHRDISKWYNVGQTRNEICVPQEFRGCNNTVLEMKADDSLISNLNRDTWGLMWRGHGRDKLMKYVSEDSGNELKYLRELFLGHYKLRILVKGSYVMQGAPFIQGMIPSIPIGGSISPEGFLPSIMLVVNHALLSDPLTSGLCWWLPPKFEALRQ
ncbi:hypothetical protein Tco_0464163 [Tanacetum coccineum]